MDLRPLSRTLTVCGQILPDDLPAIVQAGYRSIICNRPDGEAPDQPDFAEIAAAAEAAGLPARHMPVVAETLTPGKAAEFGALLEDLPGPVLAYCRSGARCTKLFELAQAPAPD